VRQYLKEVEEPVHEQDQVSTTDPDSTYATSDGELFPTVETVEKPARASVVTA